MELELRQNYAPQSRTRMDKALALVTNSDEQQEIPKFDLDGFILLNQSVRAISDLDRLTNTTLLISQSDVPLTRMQILKGKKVRTTPELAQKMRITLSLSEYQSAAPHCHDVICAVKIIWGEEYGITLLWTLQKFGLNLSGYQFPNATDFTIDQVKAAAIAIQLFPKFLWPEITHNRTQGFFRVMLGSGHKKGIAASAYGDVHSTVEDLDCESTVYVFCHEMAHRIGLKNNRHISGEWLSTPARQFTDFVSLYAMENRLEDFAESVCKYVFEPTKIEPQRLRYIEKIFSNIE